MLDKRRDAKGRILNGGEYQRNDGRYEYKYIDSKGKRRTIYSWRLVENDRHPAGKKHSPALRTLIRELVRDDLDEIDTYASKTITLNQCFEMYMPTKIGLKQSTRVNYLYMYDKFVRNSIGNKPIASIKYSTVKEYYTKLVSEGTFKVNSLDNIHTILHPVFTLAVRNGYIRNNPSDGIVKEIKQNSTWERPKRSALTEEQQEVFVKFLNNSDIDQRWKTIITVMLGTGMRIGETTALTWSDCDFKNNIISVNRTLLYRPDPSGKANFAVSSPKTASGIRTIPMLSAVRDSLITFYNYCSTNNLFCNTTVDGVNGFIFFNRYGDCVSAHNVNRAIERIIKLCNEHEQQKAMSEHRMPIIIPHFTCHNLRHTFCTRFCENETNIKVIQEIMGHSDITTTMNVYNEASEKTKKSCIDNLEGKIKIV